MTDPRFAALRRVVADALELPAAEREAFAHRECAGDAELLAEVLSLLAIDAEEGPEHTRAVHDRIAQAASAAIEEELPADIGPYRFVAKLGEGGMGVVYRAEQSGALRRSVAIKLIRAGWSSPRVVTRFESERLALARMDHRNIASVLDAGATADGRPWFVMELVEGDPLTRWCDERRLDLRERLRLFLDVCRGVQHAHQKGIIHRDLKPSNVLVTERDGEAVPKIIDFGIAKALAEPLDADAPATMAGQLLGTPEYLSPERLAGRDDGADIRTDVYSLGVMLFELLSGRRPFDRSNLRRTPSTTTAGVAGEEPPALTAGTRLDREAAAEVARRRRADPAQLRRQLAGELDWIVARALAVDPDRRYATVQGLLLDIERHLAGEAVLAGRPSALYRLRKFARRYRAAIAVTAVVMLALVVGLAESQRQRLRADAAREEAESVTDFLSQMLASVRPDEQGRDVTVRQVLDTAADSIGTRFARSPLVRARLQSTIGLAYEALGDNDAAIAQLTAVVAERRRRLGDGAVPTLDALNDLGGVLDRAGRLDEAVAAFTEALAGSRDQGDRARRQAIDAGNGLANIAAIRGDLAAADELYREALALKRETSAEPDAQTISLLNNLALLRFDQGRPEEAEELILRVLELRRRIDGPAHPLTLEARINHAGLLQATGRTDEAIAAMEAMLPEVRRIMGEVHRSTLSLMNNLGQAQADAGRLDAAASLMREILDLRTGHLGPDHVDTLITAYNLAEILRRQGRYAAAEALHRDTLERRRRILGEDHPHTELSRRGLAATRAERASGPDGRPGAGRRD